MSRKVSLKSGKYPGNDFENTCVFSRWRNVDNDSADVTSAGRSFQVVRRAATTGKARLATVDSLTGGTTRRLVPTERRDRRPGWSAMRLSGPRYCGASQCKTSYDAMTAILNFVQYDNAQRRLR